MTDTGSKLALGGRGLLHPFVCGLCIQGTPRKRGPLSPPPRIPAPSCHAASLTTCGHLCFKLTLGLSLQKALVNANPNVWETHRKCFLRSTPQGTKALS